MFTEVVCYIGFNGILAVAFCTISFWSINRVLRKQVKKVGETTNMLDIITAMQLADKVISIWLY